MLKSVLAKIGLPGAFAALIFAAGMYTNSRLTRPCPDCNLTCPQPTVSVQPFDVEKIKNLKQFSYSPAFTGSISVAGVDSTVIKRYIIEAVEKALESDKKRRRR